MKSAIKQLLTVVVIVASNTIGFTQTPYDDFVPSKKKVEMLKLPETTFKAYNCDTTSKIKYIELDEETLLLSYYDGKDSLLKQVFLNTTDFKWISVDPKTSKYPSLSPYNYVGGNPIRCVDADGRDIIVLNNPNGASGYGHMAVLIGNDNTGWVFISKEGRDKSPWYSNEITGGPASKPLIGIYTSLDAFKKAQGVDKNLGNYTQNVRFGTTENQDQAAFSATMKAAESWYNVAYSNCADAVSDGLDAAGLNPGYSYSYGNGYAKTGEPTKNLDPRPSVRFEKIKENNVSIPTKQDNKSSGGFWIMPKTFYKPPEK